MTAAAAHAQTHDRRRSRSFESIAATSTKAAPLPGGLLMRRTSASSTTTSEYPVLTPQSPYGRQQSPYAPLNVEPLSYSSARDQQRSPCTRFTEGIDVLPSWRVVAVARSPSSRSPPPALADTQSLPRIERARPLIDAVVDATRRPARSSDAAPRSIKTAQTSYFLATIALLTEGVHRGKTRPVITMAD